MFEVFKKLSSSSSANYEAARESVHKDLKIQRLQQEVDDLKFARKKMVYQALKLVKINHMAQTALTAIGDQETSGGGQASQMAFHAREILEMIKDLDKTQ
jgi:hypothetical protein